MGQRLYSTIGNVSPKVLAFSQRQTPLRLQKRCDFYLQAFDKHRGVSEFHSLAEIYHAALLEADHSVTLFVPQPILLRYGNNKFYSPDCYLERAGKKMMIELKPEKAITRFPVVFWEEFFEFHQIKFELIANEAIFKKEIKARNWLNIVRMLVSHRGLTTQSSEIELLNKLVHRDEISFGEWLDPGDRESSLHRELAVFRLAHRGKVSIDCDESLISWTTLISI